MFVKIKFVSFRFDRPDKLSQDKLKSTRIVIVSNQFLDRRCREMTGLFLLEDSIHVNPRTFWRLVYYLRFIWALTVHISFHMFIFIRTL